MSFFLSIPSIKVLYILDRTEHFVFISMIVRKRVRVGEREREKEKKMHQQHHQHNSHTIYPLFFHLHHSLFRFNLIRIGLDSVSHRRFITCCCCFFTFNLRTLSCQCIIHHIRERQDRKTEYKNKHIHTHRRTLAERERWRCAEPNQNCGY